MPDDRWMALGGKHRVTNQPALAVLREVAWFKRSQDGVNLRLAVKTVRFTAAIVFAALGALILAGSGP